MVGGGAALALAGLWLGHTLEYARVWGLAGLDSELVGSIHAYMLPLAAAIAVLAALFAARIWRLWSALGQRLDASRAALHQLMRGRRAAVPDAMHGDAPSFVSGVAVAWPALALLQIALYLVQENVEAVVAGGRAPGLGAITGTHALAPLVHAGVALVLILWAAALLHLLRHRSARIVAVESIARALLRALTTRAPRLILPRSCDARPPLQRGLRLRQRPPPALLPV